MEDKSNEATPQRPEGDRMLDASLVEMDLNKLISQIKNEVAWKDADHNAITIFKSELMRIVLIGMHENAELKTHTANGTISVQVITGKIDFTANEHTVSLEAGQMLALHEKIPHSVLALKESFFVLTLSMHTM
jgi:quercetin dioxygenase-like cupin family protein